MIEIGESVLEQLEIMYVINGLKPCCRIRMQQERFFDFRRFCKDKGLQLEVSDFKILPVKDKGNFANTGQRIEPAKRGGYHHAYISKDSALSAKKADLDCDDRRLGKLLGYSDCCIDYFLNNKHKTDPILPGTGLKIQDFRNNYYLRYFGIALVDHFPCSHDCGKSIGQAQAYLEFLENSFPAIAKRFKNELSCLVIQKEHEVIYSKDYKRSEKGIDILSQRSTGAKRIDQITVDGQEVSEPELEVTVFR